MGSLELRKLHARQKIVQEIADEWIRDRRIHVPPDDTRHDQDLAFWDEVERRLREAGMPWKRTRGERDG